MEQDTVTQSSLLFNRAGRVALGSKAISVYPVDCPRDVSFGCLFVLTAVEEQTKTAKNVILTDNIRHSTSGWSMHLMLTIHLTGSQITGKGH